MFSDVMRSLVMPSSTASGSLFISKLKAASLHGLVTLLIAIVSATVVFKVWYPDGLARMTGGVNLYFLVLGVEVCLGPLMSLVIYNPRKPRGELIRDYLVIGLIQLSALLYGLHSTFVTRPVYLVFVVDRIEVISAGELEAADLALAPEEFRSLPVFGPQRICAPLPDSPKERSDILMSAFGGKDIQLMPKYYRVCKEGEVMRAAKSFTVLESGLKKADRYEAAKQKLPSGNYLWLPIKSRLSVWVEVFPNGDESKAQLVDVDPFF